MLQNNATPVFRRFLGADSLVLWLSALLLLGLGPFTPGMLSAGNLTNVAGAMLPLLILAAGQTLVLVGGGIDLSVTSTMALASVAGARVMTSDGGWLAGQGAVIPLAIGLMLGLGALIGFANGTLITRLGMPSFIVTLTSMMFFSGLAVLLTKSRNIAGLPPEFLAVGQDLPLALGTGVMFVGAGHFLLKYGLLGRWLQAAGSNPRTALVSGVPVARVLTASYVVSGLCAAGAAVLLTARLETGSPVLGQMMMLDVIGAAVIGGTSLAGGRGSVLWTVSGVLFLSLLDNALSLRDVQHFKIMVIKGTVILAAAMLDTLRRRHQSA